MLNVCTRGSGGVALLEEHAVGSGRTAFRSNVSFVKETSKSCKAASFSPDGRLLAWSTGERVRLAAQKSPESTSFEELSSIEQSRVSLISFSPQGSILVTWEQFGVRSNEENRDNSNLLLFCTKTHMRLAGFVARKPTRPQWSSDEAVCAIRDANNEVVFYANNDFTSKGERLSLPKLESLSVSDQSHAQGRLPLVAFVPGQKGGPSFGKMFIHPNLHPQSGVVAQKSFFQADSMSVEWSHDSRFALLLTQSEVDKTGTSYYGKHQLHFLSTQGTSMAVQLAKQGPIYCIKWRPDRSEFVVVYGFMPAKATLFNSKCEKVFDFGTGPRNEALFNPQSNLLMLAGFGNLRGAIEIWKVDNNDIKEVSKFEAPDSTDFKWMADGQRLLTSTCAPRLRQGNGFKIWHYTSSLLHEHVVDSPNELWEAIAQPKLDLAKKFDVVFKPVEGIKPKVPQASKQAYRPPSMRDRPGAGAGSKLHDEDEVADNAKKTAAGNDSNVLSKSATKNQKRREKKKQQQKEQKQQEGETGVKKDDGWGFEATGDLEKDKKLRRLHEKLVSIERLKKERSEGKALEKNQLEKINKEKEIREQFEQIRLS